MLQEGKSTDSASDVCRFAAVLPEWLTLKMIKCYADIGKMLLPLVILAPTSVLPMSFPIGQAEVPSMLSGNACFTDFPRAKPMNNSDNDNNNLRQLAHKLADAYGNALMHDTPDADLEAKDLLLESASIRFSFRMLYEITKGSCQPNEHAIGALADRTCALDDKSVDLRGLTDMLSHAAYRLEKQGRSAPPADGTNGQRALVLARLGSMEHLYRMAVSLSRIYLDRLQSGVYLEAAREQLRLARKQMEIERNLCEFSDHEHVVRLQELSEIEDELNDMPDDVAWP
jgi:hypothetical protein